ncbi:MAG: NAD(P)-dependent oxidoreductase [Thermomicrobiales bacterium]
MAAVLFHAKQLQKRLENQATRTWEELHCDELRGRTMTVIGTGHIGSAVARLAGAFRMRLIGVRRNPQPTEHFDTVVGPADLHSALAETDYLVIACPMTDETHGMIGAPGSQRSGRRLPDQRLARSPSSSRIRCFAALDAGKLSGVPRRPRRGASARRPPLLGRAWRHRHPPRFPLIALYRRQHRRPLHRQSPPLHRRTAATKCDRSGTRVLRDQG